MAPFILESVSECSILIRGQESQSIFATQLQSSFIRIPQQFKCENSQLFSMMKHKKAIGVGLAKKHADL